MDLSDTANVCGGGFGVAGRTEPASAGYRDPMTVVCVTVIGDTLGDVAHP